MATSQASPELRFKKTKHPQTTPLWVGPRRLESGNFPSRVCPKTKPKAQSHVASPRARLVPTWLAERIPRQSHPFVLECPNMTDSPQPALVDLVHGASRLQLAPQFGGRLLSWRIGDRPVIHWPEHADWNDVAHVRGGNPLLFPFLARHRVDGRLGEWRDAQGVVRSLPMHGFARDLPFSHEVDADGCGVRMALVDTPATRAHYPFAFRFE